MPQPVLHKGDICAGVQEMHSNRVAQRMKTPLGFRNPTTTSFFDTRVTTGRSYVLGDGWSCT
jgi:hypothetical protein